MFTPFVLTNRAAYVKPLWDWIKSVALYGSTLATNVDAAADATAVAAIVTDFSTYDTSYDAINSGAGVTISGAEAIAN